MRDWILHVDLDQFLAAVEVLRRPELAGRPVVVGGDGDPTRPRQVVATASYEARAFGVHSGMPLVLAARKCPDAVFLPSDKPAYEAASARVMETLRSLPVVVEEWGWDEAFVGARTDDPEALAQTLKERLLVETGLSCAVGIGETKLQAKTATGFAKPGGVARLTRGTWFDDDGRPARHRPSGASATAPRRGWPTPASTRWPSSRRADHHDLAQRFGPRIGPYLKLLGLGGDDSPVVDEPHVPRSRSREETFEHDLTSRAAIDEQVARLGDRGDRVRGGRGPTRDPRRRQGPHRHVLHAHEDQQAAPADDRSGRGGAGRARWCWTGSSSTRPVRLLGVRVMLEPLELTQQGSEVLDHEDQQQRYHCDTDCRVGPAPAMIRHPEAADALDVEEDGDRPDDQSRDGADARRQAQDRRNEGQQDVGEQAAQAGDGDRLAERLASSRLTDRHGVVGDAQQAAHPLVGGAPIWVRRDGRDGAHAELFHERNATRQRPLAQSALITFCCSCGFPSDLISSDRAVRDPRGGRRRGAGGGRPR